MAIFPFIIPTSSHTIEPCLAEKEGIKAPKLQTNSGYSEYWEQQFLFENDVLLTSQFLVANLPFSKHHGMVVSTLKQPDADTIVIKNGRKRSGWNYENTENGKNLSIFQHSISMDGKGYLLRLHNTAAEVDVLFEPLSEPIEILSPDNAYKLPQITQYAPYAQAHARWRAGPEIGGQGENSDWTELGNGAGYGIHVIQRENPNKVLKKWARLSPVSTDNNFAPLLHEFVTLKDMKVPVFILHGHAGNIIKFKDVKLNRENSQIWSLSARYKDQTISGTISLGAKLEEFNLKNELNALEKIAAGSLADIQRTRYKASYAFKYVDGDETYSLSGKAIAEDIVLKAEKKKKKRVRR